ncbi:MAG: hypothetical protein ACK58L_11975 [Planctomycetota bacterium]
MLSASFEGKPHMKHIWAFVVPGLMFFCSSARAGEVAGVTVTPHVIAESMKYRRPRDPDLGAKVQLFVKGSAMP